MEEATVRVHCARTGRLMRVHFSRPSEDQYFAITDVLPGSMIASSLSGKLLGDGGRISRQAEAGANDHAVHHDAYEFDWSSFECIHCDRSSESIPVLQCSGCETVICSGSLKPKRNNKFFVSCAVCGRAGTVSFQGRIETFAAHRVPAALPELQAGNHGLLGRARGLLGRGRGE